MIDLLHEAWYRVSAMTNLSQHILHFSRLDYGFVLSPTYVRMCGTCLALVLPWFAAP